MTITTTSIQRDIGSDGIALLTIDIPNKPMNVLTDAFIEELADAADVLATDDSVRGAVITSAKKDFFAGADLKAILAMMSKGGTVDEVYARVRPFTEALRRLETTGKPVVAAINGTALGGGLEICLACHHRVAADNPAAVLGLPEVKVGLLPGAGGTQRLPRLIGVEKSLLLMVEGKHLRVAEAHKMGIVDEVVPADSLIDTARAWALANAEASQPWDRKGFKVPGGGGAMHPKAVQNFIVGNAIVAKNTWHNYPAPEAILSCVYEGTIVPFDVGLDIESRYMTGLLRGPVARNMVRTLFVNKGAADKLVRRPEGYDTRKVKTLGILGAGMMGAGIAYVSARAGMDVKLVDTSLEHAQRGRDYSQKLLEKRVKRGRNTTEEAADVLERIRPTVDYDELAEAELVIEAVFEHRGIKAEVTAKTEAVTADDSVFASNTSTLPITGLADASKRPERFIGLHFFSPVDKMPLVEIIVGEKTSQETIAHALDYVRQIRKTPILVNDSRGFYTSRVFGTYTNEGMTLLAEGVKPALIENAGRLAGMPVGPLAVLDEVTIELAYKVTEQTREDLGDDYQPASGVPVIYRMHDELKRLGKRHGRGFYDYPENGRKHLWPGLAEAFPAATGQPDVAEVKKRLLYIQALETARCVEEGVIDSAADADIGSIFGFGFPPWTGGTLSFIDTMGLKRFVNECDALAESCGPRFAVSDWLRDRARAGKTFHDG